MIYKKIGTTDLEVSSICLGTMTYGEQNTQEEGFEQMNYAFENGVNFFDTAEMYSVPGRKETQGSTETIIGNWFQESNKRNDIILATKVTGPSDGLDYISDNMGFSKSRIHDAISKSLKRLKTDYIDIYQLHWPERNTNCFGKRGYEHHFSEEWNDNFEETIETLNQLIKSGKIKHWGLSNETPFGVMRSREVAKQHGHPQAISIQNPYNLLNRTYEVGLSEISMRESIGLLAYSPVAFGRLSSKYIEGTDTAKNRINKFSVLSRYNSDNSISAAKRYYDLAKEYDITLAQLALAFVNTRPFVASTIIGATTMAQLQENIGTGEMTISGEILGKINFIHEQIPNPAP